MRLSEIIFTDAQPVEGYGPGFFRVGGRVIDGGVLILPSGVAPWDGYEALEPLVGAAEEVDVLFIGTGDDIAHLPEAARTRLEDAGVAFEIMNSPSACRTYNVLLSEGRRVGLAARAVTGTGG